MDTIHGLNSIVVSNFAMCYLLKFIVLALVEGTSLTGEFVVFVGVLFPVIFCETHKIFKLM